MLLSWCQSWRKLVYAVLCVANASLWKKIMVIIMLTALFSSRDIRKLSNPVHSNSPISLLIRNCKPIRYNFQIVLVLSNTFKPDLHISNKLYKESLKPTSRKTAFLPFVFWLWTGETLWNKAVWTVWVQFNFGEELEIRLYPQVLNTHICTLRTQTWKLCFTIAPNIFRFNFFTTYICNIS